MSKGGRAGLVPMRVFKGAIGLLVGFCIGGWSAVAQTSGSEFYLTCARDAKGGNPVAAFLPQTAAAVIALTAQDNCSTGLVDVWNAMLRRGERLCVEGGRVTANELESVFLDWARRHPQELGISAFNAVSLAYRSGFPCR